MSDEELLEFPCEFPIKVMGRDTETFEKEVLGIFSRHLEDAEAANISSRPSGSGNFISITVTFEAPSKAQCDLPGTHTNSCCSASETRRST